MRHKLILVFIVLLCGVSCKKTDSEDGQKDVKIIKSEHGDIIIGKPTKMSGPEFLEMLEKQNKANPKDENIIYLTVTLMGPIEPMDRLKKYEDPLQDALGDLANISGGGTSMNAGKIVSCDIEIDAKKENLGEVLNIIKATLKSKKAPKGSIITQYEPEKVTHSLYDK